MKSSLICRLFAVILSQSNFCKVRIQSARHIKPCVFIVRIKRIIRLGLLLVPSSILFALQGCGDTPRSDTQPPQTPAPLFPQKIFLEQQTTNHVVFAVQVNNGRHELYTANPSSGVQTPISDFYSINQGLRPVDVNFDGTRIGYRADKNIDGIDELYTNDITGGNEVQVAATLGDATVSNSGVQPHYNWQWLFESNSLIYRADSDSDGIYEIHSVAVNGSAPAVISGDLNVQCVNEHCFKTAEFDRIITFMVEATSQNSQVLQTLYRVLVDGSVLQPISQSAALDIRILDWQFSSAGDEVAYLAQLQGEPAALYKVNVNSYEQQLLSQSGLALGVTSFDWSPDDSSIGFTEDSLFAGVQSLFAFDFTNNSKKTLVDISQNSAPEILDWQWSPSGDRVAMVANLQSVSQYGIYTALNNGEFFRLLGENATREEALNYQWQWSPDGGHIAYLVAGAPNADRNGLFVATNDGSANQKISVESVEGSVVIQVDSLWSSNSQYVYYQIQDLQQRLTRLYASTPDRSAHQQLSPVVESFQSLGSIFKASPDGQKVAFTIANTNGNVALYIANSDGTERRQISGLGIVSQLQWTLDSRRLVYVYQASSTESEQLFSILADGSGELRLY